LTARRARDKGKNIFCEGFAIGGTGNFNLVNMITFKWSHPDFSFRYVKYLVESQSELAVEGLLTGPEL
jgi:hypothetical protein